CCTVGITFSIRIGQYVNTSSSRIIYRLLTRLEKLTCTIVHTVRRCQMIGIPLENTIYIFGVQTVRNQCYRRIRNVVIYTNTASPYRWHFEIVINQSDSSRSTSRWRCDENTLASSWWIFHVIIGVLRLEGNIANPRCYGCSRQFDCILQYTCLGRHIGQPYKRYSTREDTRTTANDERAIA